MDGRGYYHSALELPVVRTVIVVNFTFLLCYITEQMEHELKGLPDDAEHKEIANDYMRYLSRVDMRLDRV